MFDGDNGKEMWRGDGNSGAYEFISQNRLLPYITEQHIGLIHDGLQIQEKCQLYRTLTIIQKEISPYPASIAMGWRRDHPALRMFKGHDDFLNAWILRLWPDVKRADGTGLIPLDPPEYLTKFEHEIPWWMDWDALHYFHRSRLVGLQGGLLYQETWPNVKPGVAEIWPEPV